MFCLLANDNPWDGRFRYLLDPGRIVTIKRISLIGYVVITGQMVCSGNIT